MTVSTYNSISHHRANEVSAGSFTTQTLTYIGGPMEGLWLDYLLSGTSVIEQIRDRNNRTPWTSSSTSSPAWYLPTVQSERSTITTALAKKNSTSQEVGHSPVHPLPPESLEETLRRPSYMNGYLSWSPES